MTTKTNDPLIEKLKKQLGELPQKFDDYVKKGDVYFNQGDFAVAAGIYNLASEVAPSSHPVHEKRLDSIDKWLNHI